MDVALHPAPAPLHPSILMAHKDSIEAMMASSSERQWGRISFLDSYVEQAEPCQQRPTPHGRNRPHAPQSTKRKLDTPTSSSRTHRHHIWKQSATSAAASFTSSYCVVLKLWGRVLWLYA
ncbi:hypothetical protein WMY93_005337 [Mugilogobius chulae]|uniref:Uncharacterized protein n=1 Tax=Mugilogobius chulae TaxID=88201 RepID=A0AAW0PUI1_9GOBI